MNELSNKITILTYLLGEKPDFSKMQRMADKNKFEYPKSNVAGKCLLVFYYIGLKNNLAEYQARSFAGEMALFFTNELMPVGTEFIYKETKLDNHFQLFYYDLQKIYKFDSLDFWSSFQKYLLNFYKSNESWDFEQINYKVNLKLNRRELELLRSFHKSYRYAIRELLLHYDFSCRRDLVPDGRGNDLTTTSSHISLSEYNLLMAVPSEEITRKFLQILYYYFREEL